MALCMPLCHWYTTVLQNFLIDPSLSLPVELYSMLHLNKIGNRNSVAREKVLQHHDIEHVNFEPSVLPLVHQDYHSFSEYCAGYLMSFKRARRSAKCRKLNERWYPFDQVIEPLQVKRRQLCWLIRI
jgi:hypothetical protein